MLRFDQCDSDEEYGCEEDVMEDTYTADVTETDVASSKDRASTWPSFLHWGEPQQLDDMLGWRRACLSPYTPQGKAKIAQRCAQFCGRHISSDTTLAFPSVADQLLDGGWPPRGHVFRTCYLVCTDKVLHDVIIRGDLRNSPFATVKHQSESLQLRLGEYGLRPLRYRGIWLNGGRGSTVQYTTDAMTISNVSEHSSVSEVVHVFEAEPADMTAGFRLEKLRTGGLSPKIVFPSGHHDQMVGPLYSDDFRYSTCWNNKEQALCVESGAGNIGVWFPWKWSIPSYASHNKVRTMSMESECSTIELLSTIPRDLRRTVLFPTYDAASLETLRAVCCQYERSFDGGKELAVDIRRLQLQPIAVLDFSGRFLSLPDVGTRKTFDGFRIFVPDVLVESWRRERLLRNNSAKPNYWGVSLTSCIDNDDVTTFKYMGIYSMQLGVRKVPVHTSLPSSDFVPPNTVRCHIWQTRYAVDIPSKRSSFHSRVWSVTMDPNGTSGYGQLPRLTWSISMMTLSQAPSPFVECSQSNHTPRTVWTQPGRVVCSNMSEDSLWTQPIVMGLYPNYVSANIPASTSTSAHSSSLRDYDDYGDYGDVFDSDHQSIHEQDARDAIMQM